MQALLLTTVCSLGLVGLFTLIHAAYTAPEGVEDETGFHLLNANGTERDLYSNNVTLSEGDVIFFK